MATVKDFTAAAMASCRTLEDLEAMQVALRDVITRAVEAGDVNTRDWSTVEIPAVASLSAGLASLGRKLTLAPLTEGDLGRSKMPRVDQDFPPASNQGTSFGVVLSGNVHGEESATTSVVGSISESQAMTTYHVLLGRPRSIAHDPRWTQIRMMVCGCIATGKLKVAMPTLG